MLMKFESLVEAHFFDPSDPISITCFLAKFKVACDTNRIHEEAAMWVLLFFYNNKLATALNSRKPRATHSASVVASLNTAELTRQRMLHCSYAVEANILLTKFAKDLKID